MTTKSPTMHRTITIDETGSIRYLDVAELRVLEVLGDSTKKRASQVHPRNKFLRGCFYLLRNCFGENGLVGNWTRRWQCQWMVDLSISYGPVLGPYAYRADAIEAEEQWLAEKARN